MNGKTRSPTISFVYVPAPAGSQRQSLRLVRVAKTVHPLLSGDTPSLEGISRSNYNEWLNLVSGAATSTADREQRERFARED